MVTGQRAVFIDRDGTLIKPYPGRPANNPDEVELIPGAALGLKLLKQSGYKLIVVTNQGGIGLGHLTQFTLGLMHQRMDELIEKEAGTTIDGYYYCPHAPKADCQCRKPKPKMILDASQDFNIDLSKSYMVGDDVRDMEAGRAAEVFKNYMVVSDRYQENSIADAVFFTFYLAAKRITSEETIEHGEGAK